MNTKIIQLEENGLKYQLYQSNEKDNIYGREKTVKIKLLSSSNEYEIEVEYGTLTREIVSADGRYLILIFNQNHSIYFPPCNAVVYNIGGEFIHHLCAPILINKEILEKYKVLPDVKRRFTGGGIYQDKLCFEIGISYDDIRRPSGSSSYLETRLFNPEKGQIGDLISWDLPYR